MIVCVYSLLICFSVLFFAVHIYNGNLKLHVIHFSFFFPTILFQSWLGSCVCICIALPCIGCNTFFFFWFLKCHQPSNQQSTVTKPWIDFITILAHFFGFHYKTLDVFQIYLHGSFIHMNNSHHFNKHTDAQSYVLIWCWRCAHM